MNQEEYERRYGRGPNSFWYKGLDPKRRAAEDAKNPDKVREKAISEWHSTRRAEERRKYEQSWAGRRKAKHPSQTKPEKVAEHVIGWVFALVAIVLMSILMGLVQSFS